MSFLTNNGSKYILLYLTNRSDKNINWNTLSYLYFATVLRYPLKVEINIKTRTNKDKTSIHKRVDGQFQENCSKLESNEITLILFELIRRVTKKITINKDVWNETKILLFENIDDKICSFSFCSITINQFIVSIKFRNVQNAGLIQ